MRSKILEQENNSIPDLFIYNQILYYRDRVSMMIRRPAFYTTKAESDIIHNLVGFGRLLLDRYPDHTPEQIEVFILLKKCPSS
jgi:hypothetical protein